MDGPTLWQLSGDNYSTSGSGWSLTSGPVPAGSTYTAYFYIPVEYDYFGNGNDGSCQLSLESGDCQGFDYLTGNASIDVPPKPPQIGNLSTNSVYQDDQGMLTVTGSDFIEYSGDQLTLNFSGSGNPFTLVSAPSTCTTRCSATFSYDFSGYPVGLYSLSVSNDEGTSSNVSFTVNSDPPPADPCAVTSNPKAGYSSIVSTGTAGGSGTMAVSFSGAAFAAISPSVTYGPYSTPSSIAANLAAKITKNYFQYGLSAKAFGPNIVYSGSSTLGIVSHAITGPSFGTDTSSAAGNAIEAACSSSSSSAYYNIIYRAYIPVDNMVGPTPCEVFLGGTAIIIGGLDYLGDASGFSPTHYRIQQTSPVSTNPYVGTEEPNPIPAAGKTVNFATALYLLGAGSPMPAITANQFLEPNPLSMSANPGTRSNPTYSWEWQCNPGLESAFGYADLSQTGGVSLSSGPNAATTEFTGLATDPLEPPIGGINWDLNVIINTVDNTATVYGWNTCYPAHQISVNGKVVYDSQPTVNTTANLFKCLSLANLGVNNPTNFNIRACTAPLDGSMPCRPQ